MTGTTDSVRVAVSQHEPAWLDLAQAVQKTCDIIKEASEAGAKLVAFPECWIPGYPAWIWQVFPSSNPFKTNEELQANTNINRSRPVDFDLGVKYVQNSLRINSPEFAVIQAAAAEHQIAVSLGFSERDGESVYIAQALISSTGQIAMNRRKMKPTHMERTIFGDATGGQCLAPIVDVPEVGKVGSQTFVLHASTLLTQAGLELMGTVGSPIMGSTAVGKSAILGPDGRVLATTKTGKEELLIADC
jgi:nitrilase